MSQTNRPRIRSAATSVVTAATCLLAAGLLAGCSGDDPGEAAPSPVAGSGATTEPALATTVRLGDVTGRLPSGARHQTADEVGEVVDGWLDAAYVAGDYPRSGADAWADSWPGFTAGAAASARRDADLTSNEDLGDRIDGVEAKVRKVTVDLLAPHGRPAGATAHVRLRFRTSGEVERTVRVRGRLYLTPTSRGWRVFGYDVTKDGV